MIQNSKKIMDKDEMDQFIKKLDRMELIEELRLIRQKKFAPEEVFHKSKYLKGVRVALSSLGYDSMWVDTIFAVAVETYYFNRVDEMLKNEKKNK